MTSFRADAVLFDMDGTLTDSIAAVEAAWGKVAKDIGQDPAYVIAATHGKRAIDNLSQFKPQILSHQMDSEVQDFEESILFFADAYKIHGPGSRLSSPPADNSESALDSEVDTPSLTPGSSAPSSRASSFAFESSRRPSFARRLNNALMMSAVPEAEVVDQYHAEFEDPSMEEDHFDMVESQWIHKSKIHQLEAWQIEAAAVDRSVRILPGVKKMIDSIPAGRYAVATSGAKTYAHGCMTRVGITIPPVTITADDKRLKAGKPAPDPFLLAAKCLGYNPKKCVVFEDSPSGIRAGVASGATVIAVCTSHERSKIENCGAHFIVDNMEKVKCEFVDGQLNFTVLA
ncbi:HAD-like domain-containing protein [Lentinula aciculospora]|uniref:HAD-like domain-containing protein n=1 Tax=Lentinula aciculospora TaxID=153920 RepID=A0A9W9AI87_9AGAR|nr:HAD-like domain-containing protein [Lentinula aciculospora]